ncbi:uncharacterized protein LOC130901911 [Diorhabda carinulata]|uniref:uncharacterized protein LOC130901911 n=1 Tax=Diorhabda carinulata TaxID=1163345 RepID=UPI0025A0230D|nr:uncharacterized protein LOC130901911 [Diorhabda carinulata]
METTLYDQHSYNRSNIRSIRSPSPNVLPGIDNENSPLQIACTQESTDGIDVVWDWNSPQGKKHPRKCQKRLLQSSKKPIKKHPSVQDYEKLRKELQSLNELTLPDREENPKTSPVKQSEYKSLTGILLLDAPKQKLNDEEFDELMDDEINEKLFAISQQVAEQLNSSDDKANLKTSDKKVDDKCNLKTSDDQENNNKSPVRNNQIKFKKTSPREKALANDSFDDLLRSVDVDKLTGDSPKEECIKNEQYIYTSTQIQTNSGKVEFHRTQSFEIANSISQISRKCTQQQIEQKRKEALAKLESKRKLDRHFICLQQEIEKKRLQALAKMEAKRQQDIIERKRQEALKRLEMSRQKNAGMVKSSLVTRLK